MLDAPSTDDRSDSLDCELKAFERLDLKPMEWRDRLNLYPEPAGWPFDRSLHFVARLEHA